MQLPGYTGELHRFFFRRLRNSQDARDLTQEVYLRLLRTGNPEAVRDYRSYVYRIATHVAYEYLHRGPERHLNLDTETLTRRADQDPHRPDELYEHLSSKQELQNVLDSLSPLPRAILVLYMAEGLSCTQIAERVKLSKHTVKKYLTRTITALRTKGWNGGAERRRP